MCGFVRVSFYSIYVGPIVEKKKNPENDLSTFFSRFSISINRELTDENGLCEFVYAYSSVCSR